MKAAEVPEALLYRIFFQELAAYQHKAAELEAEGKDATALRNRHQQLTALTDSEFQTLTATALPCATTLDANQQTTARLRQDLKQSADHAPIQAQFVQLRRESDAAVAASVGQLRASLGAKRFAWLDQVVRMHVAPNLKIYSAQPSQPAPMGRRAQ